MDQDQTIMVKRHFKVYEVYPSMNHLNRHIQGVYTDANAFAYSNALNNWFRL